jgi:hypothetical protein
MTYFNDGGQNLRGQYKNKNKTKTQRLLKPLHEYTQLYKNRKTKIRDKFKADYTVEDCSSTGRDGKIVYQNVER